MDKRLSVSLQGGRRISGVLRGFDIFLNLVVDEAIEESGATPSAPPTKLPLGQVVCFDRDFYRYCDSLTSLIMLRTGYPRE